MKKVIIKYNCSFNKEFEIEDKLQEFIRNKLCPLGVTELEISVLQEGSECMEQNHCQFYKKYKKMQECFKEE